MNPCKHDYIILMSVACCEDFCSLTLRCARFGKPEREIIRVVYLMLNVEKMRCRL